MNIKGLGLYEVEEIVKSVSAELYGGNVVITADSEDRSSSRTKRAKARIAVLDGRGLGARRSVRGRHGGWACWHAYRDVIGGILERFPEVEVDTGMEKYVGWRGFVGTYPATEYTNVGSQVEPAYPTDLCDCGEAIRSIRYEA